MKPLLVIHSDDDKSVPVQQAADMVRQLKAAGCSIATCTTPTRGTWGRRRRNPRSARLHGRMKRKNRRRAGGGPAGAAASILLAAWGHPVRLITRPSPGRGLAVSIPPAAQAVRDDRRPRCDRARRLPSLTGNTVWWGGAGRAHRAVARRARVATRSRAALRGDARCVRSRQVSTSSDPRLPNPMCPGTPAISIWTARAAPA